MIGHRVVAGLSFGNGSDSPSIEKTLGCQLLRHKPRARQTGDSAEQAMPRVRRPNFALPFQLELPSGACSGINGKSDVLTS